VTRAGAARRSTAPRFAEELRACALRVAGGRGCSVIRRVAAHAAAQMRTMLCCMWACFSRVATGRGTQHEAEEQHCSRSPAPAARRAPLHVRRKCGALVQSQAPAERGRPLVECVTAAAKCEPRWCRVMLSS